MPTDPPRLKPAACEACRRGHVVIPGETRELEISLSLGAVSKALPRQKAADVTNKLSVGARLLRERVSIVVDRTPGLQAQDIWFRARVSRRREGAAIKWLRRHEYMERHRQEQDWRYASVSPYRAGDART